MTCMSSAKLFLSTCTCNIESVLSVRFEVGVSLLLAPTGADKRDPKAPFPLVGYARIQPAGAPARQPAGAPTGAGSYCKHCRILNLLRFP